MSNRETHFTIDLPVMSYYAVQNVLEEGKTRFHLYSGRVSADLAAYESIMGKRIPLARPAAAVALKDPAQTPH